MRLSFVRHCAHTFAIVDCLRFNKSGDSTKSGTTDTTSTLSDLVAALSVKTLTSTPPLPHVPYTWCQLPFVCPNPYVVMLLGPRVLLFQTNIVQHVIKLRNAQSQLSARSPHP